MDIVSRTKGKGIGCCLKCFKRKGSCKVELKCLKWCLKCFKRKGSCKVE